MKINNSYITFVNVHGKTDYPYYALYVKDPHLNQYFYLGVYNAKGVIKFANTHSGQRLKAYGRLSNVTRGKTGRYEVTHTLNGNYRVVRFKKQVDAYHSMRWELQHGYYVRLVDLETGEVLIEEGTKHE